MMKKLSSILSLLCGLFLLGLILGAFFPQVFTSHSYEIQYPESLLVSPNQNFKFGTDELGRDLLARVLYGARVSLSCAVLATLITGLFGFIYGGLSGFWGGRADSLMMRVLDVLYSIPDLLLFIILGLFFGRNFWGLLLSLSSLSWLSTARLIRGEVLKHKQKPFIEAGRALGLGSSRLLWRHLLPQTFGALAVSLILRVPLIILAESTLSFLGLGLQPPFASWGVLVSEGYHALRFHPHLLIYPSLFLFFTVFSFQTLGEKLRQNRF